VNLVNAQTGKKLTKSQLKKGEKGIIDAKDFIPLRDYFKDRNNLKRFLNVSLPEYNITTPESIITRQGESIDVSRDVVGKGIRLPDKIYQEFYEDYIDPAGIMTSPSGRSKGKTTQVKVKRIKPEFRNPTKETLDKVAKRILADVKTQDLPTEYNREIGQLVKGMALAETMVVSSEAKRAKLPVDTAVEKQLVADIKSGASELSMSEKLVTGAHNQIREITGQLKHGDPKSVERLEDFIINNLGPKLKQTTFLAIAPSTLSPMGSRGEKKLGKEFVMESIVPRSKSAEVMGVNQTLVEAGLMTTLENIRQRLDNEIGLKQKKGSDPATEIYKKQELEQLQENLADLKNRKKLGKKIIEGFKEAYDADNSSLDIIKEFFYNPNASRMFGKNLALTRSVQEGATKNNKYEEHTYQFSNWARRTLNAIKSKNPKALDNWLNWAADNYYQTVFNKTTKVPLRRLIKKNSKGDFYVEGDYTFQEIVDKTYLNPETGEKWKAQSEEHPWLAEQLDLAEKTGDYSNIKTASDIRFFNEYFTLDPNTLKIDGKTYAERYNVEVDKFLEVNPAIQKAQGKLIYEQIIGKIDAKTAKQRLNEIIKVEATKEADIAFKETKTELDNSGVLNTSEKMTTDELLSKAITIDEALRLADRPDAPVKKIRVFDFDDTLARTKSLVFYNRPNQTGKPVPRNKAIFMIGGPGSGKTNIGKGLQLGREGWKVVNQDIFIESEKSKAGLPESERDYNKEQRSLRAKIGAAGVKAAKAKLEKYTKAGDGMVIDGTGASYNATMKKVKELQEQGYEVFMVHAKTSPEAAVARNKARKERSLPTFVVERTQKSVAENIDKYKKDFGDKFMEIDTEIIEYGKPLPETFVDAVKSQVYATERGRLTAEDFAQKGEGLINQGFVMDFSDFNRVREGKRGPLFEVAETIKKARGSEDLYVLTARAPEAAEAIREFLKAEGLEIPIENITGLGNSTGEAKANWIIDKAAEGYNDFYFADDAIQNVRAVKDALSVIDVKSKVQQARLNTSEKMNAEFNNIIEQSSGIDASKVFSDVKAELRGGKKKGQRFFIPPSAEDFQGLLYVTLPKGVKGEKAYNLHRELISCLTLKL